MIYIDVPISINLLNYLTYSRGIYLFLLLLLFLLCTYLSKFSIKLLKGFLVPFNLLGSTVNFNSSSCKGFCNKQLFIFLVTTLIFKIKITTEIDSCHIYVLIFSLLQVMVWVLIVTKKCLKQLLFQRFTLDSKKWHFQSMSETW